VPPLRWTVPSLPEQLPTCFATKCFLQEGVPVRASTESRSRHQSNFRADQASLLTTLLPAVRDIRCFGSAALHLCWVGLGRLDAYFERHIKLWDYAAGALVASEAGATVEWPCPENDSVMFAASSNVFDSLRILVVQ
jgi:myo-inositol-1(or 4)-monophosphatase